jgi:hypothetical protein
MSRVGAINLFRPREKPCSQNSKPGLSRAEFMNRNPFWATARMLVVLAILLGSAGNGMDVKSEIVSESPDGKFGFREFEDGRVDLIALPSRKSVLKLGAYGKMEVMWAPDSRRFTACESQFDGSALNQTTVYERAGAIFKPVKLPELTLPATDWPGKKGRKGVEGGEFILAARWADANTLVMKRQCQCKIRGEDEDKDWSIAHEITLAFDKSQPPSIRKVEKVESTPQ